ncbi:GCN5-related N-acetyltransferase [Thalassoporum mexicanum PCC 7367]|uniref:GNAT family N-acetyltransferase n=1 Tax=Thalassoporum mexicanum TaxID=3457544 RepID=UPI00029FBEA8|nr:GNAT family N-acetyltransferase [Pseudanabaena sp. PCC 7367]AFY70189.1 GCN5-related N-acetyltransferase [Pseudanabaena sp. PCC 7367]
MSKIQIRSPITKLEFRQYYYLRWLVLRSPWAQPPGSERDDQESQSYHLIAVLDNLDDIDQDLQSDRVGYADISASSKQDVDQLIIGVGRLHLQDPQTAQIRYMAVHPNYRSQGIGSQILMALEQYGRSQPIQQIILKARAEAVRFYQHHNYQVLESAHTLYGKIPHFLMCKSIDYMQVSKVDDS